MNATQAKTPRVLDVGNCGHDHGQISGMLQRNFGATTSTAETAAETLARLSQERFDLVLINRKLDQDYSDGVAILKRIKQDPQLAELPVMLITNYPEHQEAAVALGALYGFGKQELSLPVTRERLAAVLSPSEAVRSQPTDQQPAHQQPSQHRV
jgi:CheY-like chemotaxis protein